MIIHLQFTGGRIIRIFAALAFVVALIFVAVSTTTISCLASNQAVSAKDLTYITEQYPPYNFQKDGILQGISVDLLEKIWKMMNVSLNRSVILLLPWTEGYERTLKENNIVLFSTARLPEREQLFKWAGPIASGKNVLLTKGDKNINITALEDLKRYRIGGIKDDVAVQMLLDKGVKKADVVLENTSKPITEMLENGSIDAWAYNDMTGIWQIQQSGANANDYKVAYVLGLANMYLAFNKVTPDSLVQSFQQAIDYVKSNKDKDGVTDYEKILYKYVPYGSLNSSSNMTELVSFVKSAVAYAHENGKEKALKEFSNKTGSFVRDDLYIYAYDFNGTNIAHPFKPDWIGTDKLNMTDSNGVPYIRNLINVAKEGNGFTYFIFPNPAHNNRQELKIGYAMKVDDSWWLGSGVYLGDISASFTERERDELVSFVEGALQFAKENGKQKSLAVFNNSIGNFTRNDRYIFVCDYEGRILAHPYQPKLVGTITIDDQDPNGVYFVQRFIDIAKTGKGFLYYVYSNSSSNMIPALKLTYVADVDGTWFLGSGIYAKG
jgi:polar amino acid transport system substrate-binding protein